MTQKFVEIEKKKITVHDYNNTTQECDKLNAENFRQRLTKANLVSKTYFRNILISFNKDDLK